MHFLTYNKFRFAFLLKDLADSKPCEIGNWKIMNSKRVQGPQGNFFIATLINPEFHDGQAFESYIEVKQNTLVAGDDGFVDLNVEIAMKLSSAFIQERFSICDEIIQRLNVSENGPLVNIGA